MTTKRLTLEASTRTILGRKVQQLRSQGIIPGHVFGNNVDGVSIAVDEKQFRLVYQKSGETSLVDLVIEGESKPRPVLIVGVDLHPVHSKILHVDFHQVNLKEKVSADIPVETVGESQAVADGGVLVLAYNEIEVEALPTDLPEKFEIDLTKLAAVGDTITAKDLVYDREKVSLSLEEDDVIATIQEQAAEEVVEESAEPVEVELTKQGATTEDETAAGESSGEKA